MTDTERKRIEEICKVAHVDDIGDLSDGYHTFNQLYYQRMMLFAALVKQNRDRAWKSLRHEDGELCFGGGWFIVGIDTPEGSYTYHYENKYFDLFDCDILDYAKHWDGHTEKDVTRLLSLEQKPCDDDCISRSSIKQKLQDHHDFFVAAYGGFRNLPQNDKSRVDEITNCIAMVVNEPFVTPRTKIGRWILTQRDRYIDLNCSECGSTRLKDFADGYTVGELDIKEINDLIMKLRMNYCECCGAKMQGLE